MTTETDTDIGHTGLDLLLAPGHYLYIHQEGHEAYWRDWCIELSDDYDPPHTLFTTGF